MHGYFGYEWSMGNTSMVTPNIMLMDEHVGHWRDNKYELIMLMFACFIKILTVIIEYC